MLQPRLDIASRLEMEEFLALCRSYRYLPNSNDMNDIALFITHFSGDPALMESVSEYGSSLILEKGEDFSFFSGDGGSVSTEDLSKVVKYLFMRPRVASLLKQEMTLEFSKIDSFKKKMSLHRKIAELEGKEIPKVKYPKMSK